MRIIFKSVLISFLAISACTKKASSENTDGNKTVDEQQKSIDSTAAQNPGSVQTTVPQTANSPVPGQTGVPGAVQPAGTGTALPAGTVLPSEIPGAWMGICAYNSSTPEKCEYFSLGMNASHACPAGFTFTEIAARFQGVQDLTANSNLWVGTCVRSAIPTGFAENDWATFAVVGGWYGLCVYDGTNPQGSSCEASTLRAPMKSNKTCSPGFVFQHVAARYHGLNEKWVGTCVATQNGARAVAQNQTGLLKGICAYSSASTNHSCNKGGGGLQIAGRGSCSDPNTVWSPVAARFNGKDEDWLGTCVAK